MITSETIAAYREVYDAMPPAFWPQVERMGTWADQRRARVPAGLGLPRRWRRAGGAR